MLMGIVAATGLPVGGDYGVGENPYPGALAYLNFVTRDYFLGATRLTAADILSDPDKVTAFGLNVSAGQVPLIGDMLTAFCIEEATIVAEYDKDDDIGNKVPISLYNGTVFSGWDMLTGAGYFTVEEYGDTWGYDASDNYEDVIPNRVRMAATRLSGSLSISGLGRSVVTASDTYGTLDIDTVEFGGFAGYVREIVLFEPKLDADLPALSTLS